MMYPFLTLDDEAEIVHSERKPDGQVKVYVEKPDEKRLLSPCHLLAPDVPLGGGFRLLSERAGAV